MFVDKVVLHGTKITVGPEIVDVYIDKLFKLGLDHLFEIDAEPLRE
jgi:hypothetical protein